MIHLVTFTDARMTLSAGKLVESAYKHGVDQHKCFAPHMLSAEFRNMITDNLKEEKGCYLYIWKPKIIWDYIQNVPDGQYVIYADAGQTFVDSVLPVIAAMDQDVMMFSNGWPHVEWCKADVYRLINSYQYIPSEGKMVDYYLKEKQAQASLIFFRLTPEVRDFIKRWMLFTLMPGFCDNSPSYFDNVPTFQETRWDQSVLTCLGIRYNYRLHWFPSLTNMHNKADHPNDNYQAISDHHRKRNPGATGGTDSEW